MKTNLYTLKLTELILCFLLWELPLKNICNKSCVQMHTQMGRECQADGITCAKAQWQVGAWKQVGLRQSQCSWGRESREHRVGRVGPDSLELQVTRSSHSYCHNFHDFSDSCPPSLATLLCCTVTQTNFQKFKS